jgi:hypothetical protein
MKRNFFFIALALCAGMLAPTGLSAQKRVIKVQGHPREVLTDKSGGKEDATTTRTAVSTRQVDTTWINPAEVQCWIDQPKLYPNAVDSAILIIKFTDGKNIDSVFVWGYRWNPYSIYANPVTGEPDTVYVSLHGIDILRSVANNDKRLTALLQYSGSSGHFVGGIGLNLYNGGATCSRVQLDFNMANARDSSYFSFFSPNEYCDDGQVTYPYINANTRTGQAATESRYTGILVHPFGGEYGHAAEDLDFWYPTGYLQDEQHWQSGLLKGFWGYYRADNWRIPVPISNPSVYVKDPEAAQDGITYEPLEHRQVHAFVFRPYMPTSPPGDFWYEVHYFDGAQRFMDCGCAPCPQNVTPGNVTNKSK